MSNMRNLAKTPPMGWNSFDCFGAQAREEHIKANADYLAKHLKKYGWEYVVVDIAWYAEYSNPKVAYSISALNLDEYGRLAPSPNLYPSSAEGKGFKPLASYIHSKGLKFGIHIMRGIPRVAVQRNTPILGSNARASDIADKSSVCGWWEYMYGIDPSKDGAQAYYDSIIKQYAEWGVDFIKADDMSMPYYVGEIELLRKALDKYGKNIVLSLSPGPTEIINSDHVKAHANMWRLSGDLWDNWRDLYRAFRFAYVWNGHRQPGNWPDLDMLPLGRLELIPAEEGEGHVAERWPNLTHDEQITMMTLWCISRSPLMIGGHLPMNDEWTLSLFTNKDVLKIAKSSHSNKQLYREDDHVAWIASDDDGNHYLALFNLTDKPVVMEATLDQMGLTGRYKTRDLWQQKSLGIVDGIASAKVNPHGARLLRLTPADN